MNQQANSLFLVTLTIFSCSCSKNSAPVTTHLDTTDPTEVRGAPATATNESSAPSLMERRTDPEQEAVTSDTVVGDVLEKVHSTTDSFYLSALCVTDAAVVFLVDSHLPGLWKLEDSQLLLVHQASKRFRTPLNAVRCVAVDDAGRLIVGDAATRQVYRFDPSGRLQSLVTNNHEIDTPMDIVIDADETLLVSDLTRDKVWRIPSNGGPAVEFLTVPSPTGMCFDSDDQLWIVSVSTGQLFRIRPDGTKEVVVGEGHFAFPHDVLVDDDGTAYVSDGYARTIWKVKSGTPSEWVAGAPLLNPTQLAWSGRDVLVVDPHAKGVFRIDVGGSITPFFIEPTTTK